MRAWYIDHCNSAVKLQNIAALSWHVSCLVIWQLQGPVVPLSGLPNDPCSHPEQRHGSASKSQGSNGDKLGSQKTEDGNRMKQDETGFTVVHKVSSATSQSRKCWGNYGKATWNVLVVAPKRESKNASNLGIVLTRLHRRSCTICIIKVPTNSRDPWHWYSCPATVPKLHWHREYP